jgi:Tol biopolymer transport system component
LRRNRYEPVGGGVTWGAQNLSRDEENPMMTRVPWVLVGLGCILARSGSPAPAVVTSAATITLESVSTSGAQGDLYSYAIDVSADGRYVLFNSDARNLVAHDTNDRTDAFVRDRVTGRTTRVSVSGDGAQAAPGRDPFGGSHAGGISGDGRYVVFRSDAANLVADDTNHAQDIFVRDRTTGRTRRVSVSSRGRQGNGASSAPVISADGRYVAFVSAASNLVASDTNDAADVFVRDRVTGRTRRVSISSRGRQGKRESEEPTISRHGRFIAFSSPASTLVRGDTNRLADVFVHDCRTGRTQRVSISSRGMQSAGSSTGTGSNGPAISGDGRYVAFHSDASNLVPGDTNRAFDIFVRDRSTRKTRRISVGPAGAQANAESLGAPVISGNGRYVAFASLATNLVAGDANDITDIFVRDRLAHRTSLASISTTGRQGTDSSWPAAFSGNGRYLTFSSWAGNLVPNDQSPGPDVFVRDFGRRT